ncbi:MAG: response regulator [Candidatus Electryonea clarkiae]|nr:response regulator [Candidatus Electryonea clarkiae]
MDNESREVNILIVDDDPSITDFLKRRLDLPKRTIFVADNGEKAEEILSDESIDLIILDLILPDIDGRSLLLSLRERPSLAGIPVIVLSGKDNYSTKAECFALGASVYFEKPFEPGELSVAVATLLQKYADQQREARSDPLTGLPNRAALTEMFDRTSSFAIRKNQSFCIAIFDIDHFKSVNDTYGHDIGDKVLYAVSTKIKDYLRQSDYLARWGGEEFVALFPDTKLDGAIQAIQKSLNAVRAMIFQTKKPEVRKFRVTFSAGVAEVKEGVLLRDAVAEADQFLYLAKSSGRNRIFSHDDNAIPVQEKIILAEDDDMIALLVKHRLKKHNFEVSHFTDGASALEAAKKETPELFILDIKMPVMDGFELLRNIREIPANAKTPIIILSGLGNEKEIVKGLNLGADDYLTKPFSPEELMARIHRLLKRDK